jgi:GntR family transcriptional regulator
MNSTTPSRGVSFGLDASSGVPFYRQIIQQIEHAILARKLEPGDRLPTIRALAVDLKINPNTIARAYGELEIRGVVVTQVGSGTYISNSPIDTSHAELMSKIEERVGHFVRDMTALGLDRERMAALVRDFKEDR